MAAPQVKTVHKFTVSPAFTTSSSIGGVSTHSLPATIDPSKTWAIYHARTTESVPSKALVGLKELTATEIKFVRGNEGTPANMTIEVQLVEFSQGVSIQRRAYLPWERSRMDTCGGGGAKCDYSSQATENDPITAVNTERSFVTVKPWSGMQKNCGDHGTTCGIDPTLEDSVDIVGEMFVIGRFNSAGTEVVFDHNGDTIGQSGDVVGVSYQVVEFDQDARVWYGELDELRGIRAADVVDEIVGNNDDPPDLRKTFLLYSDRIVQGTSGIGSRPDEWSCDGGLFNGTGGVFEIGPNATDSEFKEIGFFVVELDFAYVESYTINAPGTGGAQSVDESLGDIRDADNSVALIPWNQWGGRSSSSDGNAAREVMATVEVVDENTLRWQRESSGAAQVCEVFVIEFQEPPDLGLGTVEFKRIFSGDELAIPSTEGSRDVALPAAVDPSKCIVWATAAGRQALGDTLAWVDFIDSSNIRLHLPGSDDHTSVTWYLIEFAAGVEVQRGVFDFTSGLRASTAINPVDPNRAFVLQQYGRRGATKGMAFLSGSNQVRGIANGTGAATIPPVAWQVVQLSGQAQVFHYGLAWGGPGETSFTERTMRTDPEWSASQMFWWTLAYAYSGGIDVQHADDTHIWEELDTGTDRMTAHRGGADAGLNSVHEIVNLGPFTGTVPVRESHFVQFDDTDGGQKDVTLTREYDPDNTAAWVPFNGNQLVGNPGDGNSAQAVRLEIIDPTTLRLHRESIEHDTGEVFEGYVHIIGFPAAPESLGPEGPEGFYFGDLGGNRILKFGSTNRDG